MITYLRTGRTIRGTGTAIWKSPDGVVKIKPSRDGWGCILVTPEEIEAGREKPAIRHRERLPEYQPPKRKSKPKPTPLPRWKQIVEQVRAAECDSRLFPGITMALVSELADELEAAQNLFQAKP